MKPLHLRAVLLALLLIGSISIASSQAKIKKYSLIISNVSIIPIYKDTIIRSIDLYIIGGKIEKIEKHDRNAEFKLLSDIIINGSGKYLMPSLIDCHVHYGGNRSLFGLYDSLYLKYGVTKVLALNGTDSLLEHRKRKNNKSLYGPDIYCSSPRNNDSLMTAVQADSIMKDYKLKGYEFIKVYSDLSKSAFNEFSEKAKSFNLRVLGHIPQKVGTYATLKSNVELIVHAEEFLYNPPINYFMGEITHPVKPNEQYIDQVADSVFKYKKLVSPTLIAFKSILESAIDIQKYTNSVPLRPTHPIATHWDWSPTKSFVPKKFNKTIAINRLQYGYDYQLKLVKALDSKGIVILAGTDAPTIPGLVPGYSLHQELQLLSEAGMPNYEILKSATLNAAQFLNISNVFGTIEVGKEASFILLSKNPLTNIKNTLSIKKIVLNGKEYK